MNGAESLIRSLIASGVDTCFTNPGTSEMHFVAALDHVPGMRSVLALFEGVATGAADGYYRMTGNPACTLLHLGPGLANGLANLHNAKKAGSGIVNIVGEHAESHLALDAPLKSDIQGLARPMSHWVHSATSAAEVGRDGAAAVTAARTAPGQIATLILPSDTAWSEGGPVVTAEPPAPRATVPSEAVVAAARALSGPRTLLLLGGQALTAANLDHAGRIAAKTGCALLSEWSNARLERGAGRVSIGRIPYPIDQALQVLEPFDRIVLVGARPPIGFFAYPGKPARLTRPDAEIIDLADWAADLDAVLDGLEQEAGAAGTTPLGLAEAAELPVPTGALTPETIGAALGATIPENAIVIDEAVTTGRSFFPVTAGAPPHSWINNRGGSIGYSLPVAIGCALACPDRKVLALSGDGSAMYTPQALWTMAREGLDVTVLIFANRSYQILRGELTNVGVQNPGPKALDMLSLDRPAIDWVGLAKSLGLEAYRVDEAGALTKAIETGLALDGPVLIEVVM
ncbi:acetolactate synthase large subunit [Pseudooceanicola lipolyticus]|uniref:Acetolactate synthase large subunit n=1 Tax=Pseudooceanicola lipolyticus TaxID=2029104 RepID=A0A2M8IV88_9RHOB|nr:acetolactate synthase large subunit [Pseudooceanicola lipolyticus]PJE34442.1 acetolactate synthase large subunit [Pseudooceanicola lipolyticus]